MHPDYVTSLPCCWGDCGHLCAAEIRTAWADDGAAVWYELVPEHERCRWGPSVPCETADLAIQSWYGFIDECHKNVQLSLF